MNKPLGSPMNKAVEQRGAEAVCKTAPTGSIPAIASTFIEVMERDDPDEMLSMMCGYYERIGVPGWTEDDLVLPIKKEVAYAAHDMVRLGLSIIVKYRDLKKKYVELSKENSRLKRQADKKTLESIDNLTRGEGHETT